MQATIVLKDGSKVVRSISYINDRRSVAPKHEDGSRYQCGLFSYKGVNHFAAAPTLRGPWKQVL